MRLRLKSNLPLTVTLPLFVALAMFLVAVTTTQIGVSFLQDNSQTALRDQAVVFLDAVAGNIAAEIDDNPEAVREQLAASLTFRTALLEEAMAARLVDAAGTARTVVFADKHYEWLTNAFDETAGLAIDSVRVWDYPEEDVLLVLRTYSLDEITLFLSATFDTRPVMQAADTASRFALGIDLLVAIIAALAAYAITRRSLAPLDGFIERLAHREEQDLAISGWRRGDELHQLEAALALREQSESRRAQLLEQMAQQERDALLARMAAAIAHEVRNPLAGLKNGVSTLKRFGDREDVRDKTLDLLEKGLDSIGRVVDVTLSTYRRRPGNDRLSADDIRDLDLLIQPEAKRANVHLHWELDDTIIIEIDADALRQILINLLLNAVRASPPDGTVIVSLARGGPDDAVVLGIEDNGKGMPPEVVAAIVSGQMENIPVERSIGIWIVANLVERIGASLSIRSEDGHGTTVKLTLPRTARQPRMEG
jgi:signal transduction histidine kinase